MRWCVRDRTCRGQWFARTDTRAPARIGSRASLTRDMAKPRDQSPQVHARLMLCKDAKTEIMKTKKRKTEPWVADLADLADSRGWFPKSGKLLLANQMIFLWHREASMPQERSAKIRIIRQIRVPWFGFRRFVFAGPTADPSLRMTGSGSCPTGCCGAAGHVAQQLADGSLQVAAMDHGVEHPMVEEELRRLEAFG